MSTTQTAPSHSPESVLSARPLRLAPPFCLCANCGHNAATVEVRIHAVTQTGVADWRDDHADAEWCVGCVAEADDDVEVMA